VITSKGLAGSREYLGYVLSGACNRPSEAHEVLDSPLAERDDSEVSFPSHEVTRV
jgi:hypothetical protein